MGKPHRLLYEARPADSSVFGRTHWAAVFLANISLREIRAYSITPVVYQAAQARLQRSSFQPGTIHPFAVATRNRLVYAAFSWSAPQTRGLADLYRRGY